MININEILVYRNTSLHDALVKLDKTGHGVLLLVDKNEKFERTITDGDLRRLLISNGINETTLEPLPIQDSMIVSLATTAKEALEIMNKLDIKHLPVVENNKIVSVWIQKFLNQQILLSTPHMGEYELGYIEDAFRDNWIAPLGPNVDAFETELASYVQIAHAAALSSGTAALHLALCVLGVTRNDFVFCSSFTFVASANAILYQGAIPVFIDSDPETWNMSSSALERAFSYFSKQKKLPKAVMVVNLYGQSADMDALQEICDHYQVPIVEDAAESLGATYKGKYSGTLTKLGVYSFNGNKIITTSGGGMLVSNDEDLIKKARFLSTQARETAPYYEHVEMGYNYRMSNILAGIGRGQLKVLESRVSARRKVFNNYLDGLFGIESIEWMPEAEFGSSTRWLSACIINKEITLLTPTNVIEHLAKQGIEARRVWKPMHLQPLFVDNLYFSHNENVDICKDLFDQGLCLPSGSNLSEENQFRVTESLKTFLS